MTTRIFRIAAAAAIALGAAAPMAMAYSYAPGTITAMAPGQDSITINGHSFATGSVMTEGHRLHVGERVLYKVDGRGSEPRLVAAIPAKGLGVAAEFDRARPASMPLPRDLSGSAKARADGNLGAPVITTVTRDAPVAYMSGEAKQAAMMARG